MADSAGSPDTSGATALHRLTRAGLAGAATGVGSMPGTAVLEAARIVVGELPQLPHLPELPERGPACSMIGRMAALLVDLPLELVPSGFRAADHPGRLVRRATDAFRGDLDLMEQALASAGGVPTAVKLAVAGPWTLGAQLELRSGHRMLTDSGAMRDLRQSMREGVRELCRELSPRFGAPIVVQLDEPQLPAVRAGALPGVSGLDMLPPVPDTDISEGLDQLVAAIREVTGAPVLVHCCGQDVPFRVLRAAGVDGVSFDASAGVPTSAFDPLAEAWEAGMLLGWGSVPVTPPGPAGSEPLPAAPDASTLHSKLAALARDLGFSAERLRDVSLLSPACGLSGCDPRGARDAMATAGELARRIAEDPAAA